MEGPEKIDHHLKDTLEVLGTDLFLHSFVIPLIHPQLDRVSPFFENEKNETTILT